MTAASTERRGYAIHDDYIAPRHRSHTVDVSVSGGGLDVKHWLLEHESELPERAVAKPERRLHALAPRPGGRTPSGRRPGSHLRH